MFFFFGQQISGSPCVAGHEMHLGWGENMIHFTLYTIYYVLYTMYYIFKFYKNISYTPHFTIYIFYCSGLGVASQVALSHPPKTASPEIESCFPLVSYRLWGQAFSYCGHESQQKRYKSNGNTATEPRVVEMTPGAMETTNASNSCSMSKHRHRSNHSNHGCKGNCRQEYCNSTKPKPYTPNP